MHLSAYDFFPVRVRYAYQQMTGSALHLNPLSIRSVIGVSVIEYFRSEQVAFRALVRADRDVEDDLYSHS